MIVEIGRPPSTGRPAPLAATGAMPLVLLAGWLAADALQPAEYSPVRQTISVAAGHAGAYRWVGTSALLVIGVGFLLCAVVLPGVTRWGRLGLLGTGVCGLGVALCPEAATGPTPAHEFFSVTGAVFLALGPLFTYRRDARGWAQRPACVGTAFTAFVALTAWMVYELNAGHAAGLAERTASTVEVAWPFVLALSMSVSTVSVTLPVPAADAVRAIASWRHPVRRN